MNDVENTNSFRVRVYRAVDDPALCIEYMQGHIKVLTDFGIENITSNNAWTQNPYMYCVVAERISDNKLVGGIRVQVADGITPLPVELAIGKMDDRIHERVMHYATNGGVGELCGLWVDNSLKGVGMSYYLVRAAIASSHQLNFKTMIGICAGYTLKMFQDVGFTIDHQLGDEGNFTYPNDNYIAHVVGILNAVTLETASNYDKIKMLELRNNPVHQSIEINRNVVSQIFYNLRYQKVTSLKQLT